MKLAHSAYTTQFERHLLKKPPAARSIWGQVTQIGAQSVHITGLSAIIRLGDLITIRAHDGLELRGEIISLQNEISIAMMHGSPLGLRIGAKAYITEDRAPHPSHDWIGRVLNHSGCSIDGQAPLSGKYPAPLHARPPEAILRKSLGERLQTGVTAIDTFLPLCQGQRVGLFAGSGVGKSTLLGALAKGSNADINIIALIGERGREVRSFVEKTLGPEGMKKSIVFVATSNELSALKLRTALLAMATAEYFRDQGKQVLFLFDSITRYAEAHRDVALTAGEVPSLRAYPPSTFGALAALCERAGPGIDSMGDITAVFSVLVAGSNMEEPIADMVRGILDGHIILDRDIAERGRYPAINLPRSVSRALPEAATDAENANLLLARRYITQYEESRTLIQAGLYVAGTDALLDKAIDVYAALDNFIGDIGEPDIKMSFEKLNSILHPQSEASVVFESKTAGTVSQNDQSETGI
ncbi:FliI/YscN family ATPase [Hellea sp.]|nr:FliI/YscN family ATPase [Hellea sp.]